MSATRRRRQRGFSIVSAIFIIVVLAVLAAALVTVATMQHASAGLDVHGARAYQAARAGAEWGVYRIINPDAVADPPVALPANDVPSCWSPAQSVSLGGGLAAFTVSVSCTRTRTTELDRIIGVYSIVSTATFGAPQQSNHVSREVQVTVSRCKPRPRAGADSNSGSVDLKPRLSAAEIGNSCVNAAASAASNANQPWLQYRWSGNEAYDQNPTGRASFGQARNSPEFIYFRENY